MPCRRSSDQIPIVIAGMNTNMIIGRYLFNCPKFAKLALKNSCGQNAASEVKSTNKHRKT